MDPTAELIATRKLAEAAFADLAATQLVLSAVIAHFAELDGDAAISLAHLQALLHEDIRATERTVTDAARLNALSRVPRQIMENASRLITGAGDVRLATRPRGTASQPPTVLDLTKRVSVSFDYTGAKGDAERRTVDVVSVYIPNSDEQGRPDRLRGLCHARKASREFVLARATNAADASGQAIADFGAWLLAQPSRRRPRDLDL